MQGKKEKGEKCMLTLLLGRDWTANRQEILNRIRMDVLHRQGGRVLMVPELISHDTERRLCAAAGDPMGSVGSLSMNWNWNQPTLYLHCRSFRQKFW